VQPGHVMAEGAEPIDYFGHRPRCWVGPGRVGIESAASDALQNGLCHDRARRIPRAEEQHIEGWGHIGVLLGGKQAGDIAAQLWAPAATSLGQEADEFAQRDDAHGVDDLPALAGGLGKSRPFQCAQVERCRGAGQIQAIGDLAGGQAGRTGGDQQPQDGEACFLRQRGEDLRGCLNFHASSLVEIWVGVTRQSAGARPAAPAAAPPGC
jgi:hypothetical protein